MIGSTRVARRAGMRQAAVATQAEEDGCPAEQRGIVRGNLVELGSEQSPERKHDSEADA